MKLYTSLNGLKSPETRSTLNQEGHDIEVCILRLAQVLGERQWRMASAESCTGGWIAKCCTDLAGSSAWFERGFVTYSNEAKMEMLGVKSATLEESGAVSEPVAQEMARGACHSSHADVALSVTGIAGPDGGTAEKPVGMVCFSWFLQGPAVFSETCYFEGNRDAVRRQAVLQALSGMLERIDN